ncbi:MAG: PH domain-containing protein [Microlunatus sp.]|nr:PH domain-containing protein [Microlunatus sp.]
MVSYPRRMRIVGTIFSVLLLIAVFVGWIALPRHLRMTFTPFQLVTLLLVLAAIIGVIMSAAMSMVRADPSGLVIRNALRTHRVGWQQVRGLVYRDGDPWPTLLINDSDDPDKIMLLGIQRTDHARADAAVATLRRLRAESTP